MKILKTLGIILAILVAIVLITPAFLASEKVIERTVTVNAPVKSCFVLVNDLKSWTKWSPWYKMDTTSRLEYSEVASGVDAWYTWASNNSSVGEGKLTITHSSLDSVVIKLEFKAWGESSATYFFEQLGDNETKVGTRMVMESGNYLGRWFNLLMAGSLSSTFDKGLADLKKVAEETPQVVVVDRVEEVEVLMLRNLIYLYQTDTVASTAIGPALGLAYGNIMGAVQANNLQMSGAPFAIYHSYDPEGETIMSPAIPVNELKSIDGLSSAKIDSQMVLQVNYYGTFEGSMMAHEKIQVYADQNGYEYTGGPFEFYITDPMEEKDPAKVLTQIAYPVRKK
ncbi:MAG: hypothetical protein EP332_07270 [Bacteroidetes bacterium]|nr:MAG: hypothetical protein EP332_07270 [Bacteroidota bacterium]